MALARSREARPGREDLITGNYRSVQRFYSEDSLWTTVDAWHRHVDTCIGRFLRALSQELDPPPRMVVNIGSGGHTYDVFPERQFHVDLLPQRLAGRRGIVAQAERLPLRPSRFDLALCVGSVINHGDAVPMISEMARILRPGGTAVLEFESLDGLHRHWRSPNTGAMLVDAFYNDRVFRLVEYSRSYVESTMTRSGLVIENRHSFHIGSGLALRLSLPPPAAAPLIHLDGILRGMPPLRYRGHNLVLVARRCRASAV
jgi:SAM-dependent methyltransferase